MEYKDFPNIKDANGLLAYFNGREYKHSGYFHYTTMEAADKILGNNSFLLSNVVDFNDTLDTKQFGEETSRYFSLCFSTGINENLPLWYLYSGVKGDGVRISLTKTGFRKLLDKSEYSLVEWNNDKRSIECVVKDSLKVDSDLSITCKDVLYYDVSDEKCSIKYNNMTNYAVSKSELLDFQKKNIGFSKAIIWYYEKETRIVIKISDSLLSMMKKGKPYKIQMKNREFKRYCSITLAPNDNNKNIISELEQNSSLKDFLVDSSKVKLSKYDGTVSFKICSRCDKPSDSKAMEE